MLPTLDPTHYTALHSLDLASVQSPDGRDHPLDAYTPVSVSAAPTDPAPVTPASFGLPSLPKMPEHIGARFVVGTLAILLVVLAVWRLIR